MPLGSPVIEAIRASLPLVLNIEAHPMANLNRYKNSTHTSHDERRRQPVLCRRGARDDRGSVRPPDVGYHSAESIAGRTAPVRGPCPAGSAVRTPGGGLVEDADAHDLGGAEPGRARERHGPGGLQGSGMERIRQAQVSARTTRHKLRRRERGVDARDRALDEPAAEALPDHGVARTGGGVGNPADPASMSGRGHPPHGQLPRPREPVPQARQAVRGVRPGSGRFCVLVCSVYAGCRHRSIRARPAIRIQEADHRTLRLRAAAVRVHRRAGRRGLCGPHRAPDRGVARRRRKTNRGLPRRRR